MNRRLFGSLCFAQLVALCLYLSGFLLRRLPLPDRAPVADTPSLPPTYHKCIILLVDAWRHDFAIFNHSNANPLTYQNKMALLDRRLANEAEHARLYHIYADPPTTTMQRIKAIATGSLPTFVEFSDNFAASTLSEDNFISRLNAQYPDSVVFVGDDTWEQLAHAEFNRSYYYPSLDVADLDTVDRGVYQTMPREMENNDWRLLIGHMLGVDHCGHTFGPLTHHIGSKLTEVDAFIESITNQLDNDTILLAFGDHGMTVTGDHGGESDDETGAALYVYAPKGFRTSQSSQTRHINQIDLSATVPLLLGAPIPFNSLGTPLTDLFAGDATEYQILSHAYRQIVRYLSAYAANNGASLDQLIPQSELQSTPDIRRFIENARGELRRVWAQFDLFTMAIGAALSACIATLIGINNFHRAEFVLAALLAAFATSNSFIIMEDQIIQFMLHLATALQSYIHIVQFKATHLAALVTQHSLLRLVFELRRCRPEQWWCYSATTKSAGFAHVNGATVALCISLGVFVWRNWRFIKGSSLIEVITRSLILPLIGLLWFTWTMQLLPKDDQMSVLVLNLTRILVVTTGAGLALSYWLSPFTIRVFGAQYSKKQTGIMMRIQPPKIEVNGLETAPEGEKVLQMIWMTLFWALTLGAQLAPAASVLLLDLTLSDYVTREGVTKSHYARRIRSVRAFLLASYFFYASGKSTTIAGLPMQAAAVGAFPFFTMVPPLLVIFNCYGSQIIILHHLSRDTARLDQFGVIVSLYAVRLFGCICSTFMHRRHLMVWNVFAPRLLFEAAEFVVVAVFCVWLLFINWIKAVRFGRLRNKIIGSKMF